MLSLLTGLYNKAETIKGKNLVTLLVVIFVSFLFLGLSVGYITNVLLKNNEAIKVDTTSSNNTISASLEGKIVFVEPRLYPLDDISYALISSDGKELALLKSSDQKLKVSEGHFAQVFGTFSKTKDGQKDVLIVDKIVIKNQ